MTVVGLPNFRVSRRMRIRCCSFSISPQTHKSFGSPHVVQTSAMNLTLCIVAEIYKTFKMGDGFCGRLKTQIDDFWLLLVIELGFERVFLRLKAPLTRPFSGVFNVDKGSYDSKIIYGNGPHFAVDSMIESIETPLRRGITWRQPVVFAVSTAVSTVLAIWAVVAAPTGQSPVPGVSGLYIAAAVYVPLALWFGVWGSLAGYFSCLFMGLYLGLPLPFLLVWSLADFFEGFVPLMFYRSLRIRPALKLKHPKVTYGLAVILALDFVVSALALVSNLTEVFIATFIVGIVALVAQAAVEDRKTWIIWLVICVFVASLISGVFGVGAMVAFGNIPAGIFPTVFFGWVFGDIIVLSTIGTILTIVFTPYVLKTRAYVRKFFS